jgi:hypothetical protein
MADSIQQAKHDHAVDARAMERQTQRDRAAAFWRQAVDEGRILRQSGAIIREQQATETEEESATSETP